MNSSDQTANDYSTSSVQELVETHYGLDVSVRSLPGYIDLNFLLTDSDGTRFVLKIANTDESLSVLEMQNGVMGFLQEEPIGDYLFPQVITNKQGSGVTTLTGDGSQLRYMRILSWIPGVFYVDHKHIARKHHQQLGQMLGQLDTRLTYYAHHAAERFLDWDLKHAKQVIDSKKQFISNVEQRQQIFRVGALFEHQVTPFVDELPQSVIHNDVNDYNLLMSSDGANAKVSAVIDFGDMVKTYTVNELAIACAYGVLDKADSLTVIADITQAYHQERSLTPAEAWVLFPLICARLATSVCNSAEAIHAEPDNDYLLFSAAPAWRTIALLLEYDPQTVAFELQRLCAFNGTPNANHQQILAHREKHLFKTLSVSYEEPLEIERGQGQFLLDSNNIAYLDMVNNVCHVGHCHPHVVKAGQNQMARLNTNTRYLNTNLVKYSEQLLDKFPQELSVVMFVNSGSEANELAMRLMQCFRQSDETIVIDGAYHGNTGKTIEISPYKFNGPGGNGPADGIHTVPMPDPYRGEHKGMSSSSGQLYAEYVRTKIADIHSQGKKLGGFICESLLGVGGNLVMPDGYLKAVYEAVREAGGVCIADEVQVGFGRVGSHWWGFETQGVIPDIVTLGKPIGNGHPLAAVVTTPAIAAAFETGMEYFNTFGGNPVSCAIGSAVLETIDSENLMANAASTGQYLQQRLRDLQPQFPIIGDVRGLGLFIGVELIADEQLTPASAEAKRLIELLKARHILLSLDGPHVNVLKIKPPMVFNRENVDYFITALEDCLKLL